MSKQRKSKQDRCKDGDKALVGQILSQKVLVKLRNERSGQLVQDSSRRDFMKKIDSIFKVGQAFRIVA